MGTVRTAGLPSLTRVLTALAVAIFLLLVADPTSNFLGIPAAEVEAPDSTLTRTSSSRDDFSPPLVAKPSSPTWDASLGLVLSLTLLDVPAPRLIDSTGPSLARTRVSHSLPSVRVLRC